MFSCVSYGLNNPSRYTDPTGHAYCDFIDNSNAEDCAGGLANSQSTDVIWGNGNNGGGEGGGDDDDDSPGHDYGNIHNEPNLVCLNLSWINCTEDEVAGYLTQFQYPGQWPWSPVFDNETYNVYPAEFLGIPNPVLWLFGMGDSGAIWVDIDDNNPLIITNNTQDTHIFNVGDVVRKGFQEADGNWYVSTHGKGTNDGYGIIPGPWIDSANDALGPIVFEIVDFQLVTYTTIVETGQYISSFLP